MRRKSTYERGLRAERAAALLLMLKGYRILRRRARTRAGEIDIIARRGKTLVFVEVKHRPTLAEAAEAIRPRDRMRLEGAANALLACHSDGCNNFRIDVVLLAPGRWPQHIRGV
jgi:putative endonuclease